ncbi:hypothetical protein EAO77_18305 [Streptomyces sp. t39]|nr:hypothetical protein EAO77_18305 [Streptomyces sp. t39]
MTAGPAPSRWGPPAGLRCLLPLRRQGGENPDAFLPDTVIDPAARPSPPPTARSVAAVRGCVALRAGRHRFSAYGARGHVHGERCDGRAQRPSRRHV